MWPEIVFLGGIFTPNQLEFVEKNSKGVVQNAADALQKSIILGFVQNGVDSLNVVNLPFIGSYPRGFESSHFPPTAEVVHGKVKIVGQRFSLVRVVKSFSRMFGALNGLASVAPRGPHVVLVYSAHLPFLAAALLHGATRRGAKVCLILPDFPEFMGEGGWKYKFVKGVESRVFYALSKLIDGFVLLTPAMAERLRLTRNNFTVVEGIAAPPPSFRPASAGATRVFLYTGTLARRYGIMDLVDSFRQLAASQVELWICGDGDARADVIEASRQDSRIKYYGQVSREKATEFQSQATVLVNPRRPAGEFTKYSFPSKTLEYMASGRPVLMYPLPGMPKEYDSYFLPLDAGDPKTLSSALLALATADLQELQEKGMRARKFVAEEKNAKVQSRKILTLVSGL